MPDDPPLAAGRETIRFLARVHQVWCNHFPDLHQRALWHLVMHLGTDGREGAAVGALQGMVRQVFLLDDATVRDRIERLAALRYCTIDPPDRTLSARSFVLPSEALLRQFDAHLLAIGGYLAAAAGAVAPALAFQAPPDLQGGRRQAVLAAMAGCRAAWFEAAEAALDEAGLSRARTVDARRHLQSGPHWLLLHLALEHAAGISPHGPAGPAGLQADRMAAVLVAVNGQNFQTTRDHLAELQAMGLLERRPGRALHVALATAAVRHFAAALARAQADLPRWAAPLAASLGTADDGERTMRYRSPEDARAPRHRLTVLGPDGERREVPIGPEGLTVGRVPGEEATLVLAAPDVSRRHCRIEVLGEAAQLTDLGSTNGTLLDGHKVTGPVALMPGARLRVGRHELVYALEAPALAEAENISGISA